MTQRRLSHLLDRLSTPDAYRRVTLVALLALGFIIVTGGAVRLTGSGLGCPDWPTCEKGRLLPPGEYHALVEFVNRMVTFLVAGAVSLAVLCSRHRRPRRADLVRLSWGLVAGVVAQGLLGGLTVLLHLKPPVVMAHFLLSMVILANAVVLHWRAGRPDEPPPAPVGPPPTPPRDGDPRRLGWLMLALTALVVFLGTVVTAAGPHGGDETAERLDVPLHRAAQLHGTAAMTLLAMAVAMVVVLRRGRAPAASQRRALVVLAVVVGQAGIGYLQYFLGVPVLLVGAHIAGAATLWALVVRFQAGLAQPAGDVAAARRPATQLAGA